MTLSEVVHAIRQNHALEHATMHMLTRRDPYASLMGRSTASGFYIYGPLDTHDVAAAASEALARLQQGEAHLAVHPRCGTNLVVTSVLAGTAAYTATMGSPRSRLDRLPLALMGATLAAIAAQPLSHRVQEAVTTTPDLDGVYIESVAKQQRGKLTVHRIAVGR